MQKLIIAIVVSAVILTQGYQQSAFIWLCAALACITLETAIFNNLVFFIPAAAAAAGAMAQFSTGDAHTTMIASSVAAIGMTVLLFKELSRDKKAEEKARLANLKKVRNLQY